VRPNRFFALTAVFLLAGCDLSKQSAPALTGPSELGMSLAMTASPDILTQDGKSQSFIEVTVRDASSQPARGVALRIETSVNGTVADFGELSTRSISTGNDGKASFTYNAPPPPPASASSDNVVDIVATPVGGNYGNTISRFVTIRLKRPNNPLPNGAPVAKFFASPTTPKENDDVLFDGSASTDDGKIASYNWNFGDGGSGSGVRAHHSYALAGSYQVTLTVTDDGGASATSDPVEVQVGGQANPVADFVTSPSTARVGATVNFNAATSTAPTGHSITSYQWNFGDGSIGAGVAPTHVYGAANSYQVTLTITDSTGRSSSISKTVTITP